MKGTSNLGRCAKERTIAGGKDKGGQERVARQLDCTMTMWRCKLKTESPGDV